MAKRDVIKLILNRGIKDGKWHCNDERKSQGLSVIRKLREKIQQGTPETDVLNLAENSLEIHYDHSKKCHVLEAITSVI
tara:strand:- start:170 stop:406 length:237 start_codon:yes stop_codon:yes gene_type:complete